MSGAQDQELWWKAPIPQSIKVLHHITKDFYRIARELRVEREKEKALDWVRSDKGGPLRPWPSDKEAWLCHSARCLGHASGPHRP